MKVVMPISLMKLVSAVSAEARFVVDSVLYCPLQVQQF